MGHTIMGEIADLPTRPRGAMGLPPWSQFPVYSRGGDGKLRTSTYRIVSGGYFPMTSFDPLARDQRKRAMCSIGWDVIALPGGGLEDIVSGRIISSISWVAKAGYGDQRGYIRTSETRMYGNPEGLANPENDSQRAGWWMVEPGKLPTGFVGDAGEHTFLLHSVAEMVAHLNAFMKRCGIVENVIEARITRQQAKGKKPPSIDDWHRSLQNTGPGISNSINQRPMENRVMTALEMNCQNTTLMVSHPTPRS